MRLSKISISGVRNINSIDVQPSSVLNLIIGKNGSGKTSFLESLFVLGTGRSFRATRLRSVVQSGQEKALVYGMIQNDVLGIEQSQGVEIARNGKVRARQDGIPVTNSSSLAYSLPVQLINSDTFLLLDGGPKTRRQYMDWGLFHVEPGYAECWRRFSRALKQRNQLLRYGKLRSLDQQLQPWNEELSACASSIHLFRKTHIEELAALIEGRFERMCLAPGLVVSYKPGWNVDVDYAECLSGNLDKDRSVGYTREGPHRADLDITLGGVNATDRLSRGQSKMLVCALKLVQGDILTAVRGHRAIYLVDDLPSELDRENRNLFLSQLVGTKGQVFITATDSVMDGASWDLPGLEEKAVFHVEQGSFSR